MANDILNRLNTGLLSYSRKKEFLGLGLNYRETEFFEYQSFFTDYSNYSPSLLVNSINALFTSIYSGNIYCDTFQIPGEYNLPSNDAVRAQKFITRVENRVNSDFTNQSEFVNNPQYTGINSYFWTTYGTLLDSFSENYDYIKKIDGSLESNHSLSFSLITGGYNFASGIANYVYNGDVGNSFYTNLTSNLGLSGFVDPTLIRQIYSENYDLLKNNYSFSKKTEYPSINSDSSLQIKKDIKNSIILDDNGIITVTENGKIKAFLNFNQSVSEFNNSVSNNNIYNRCTGLYNSFLSFGNIIGGSSLNNYPIKNDVIFNKPELTVSYDISFNDDSNFSLIYDTTIEKTIEIELIEEKYINITHNYNFTRLANIITGQTGIMMNAIISADNESASLIPNYYQNSQLYNPFLQNIPRIKESFSLPTRKRNFNAKFQYSNEPIYFITVNGVTYPKLQYKIIDEIPKDLVNEYKIISRPSKTSVLSYEYQTSKGSRTIEIQGFLTRNYGLTYTNPQNINSQFFPLFSWGVSTLLGTFQNLQVLNLSYALSDCKLKFDSENSYLMSITIEYVIKKYYS